jgi:hypothetical protein
VPHLLQVLRVVVLVVLPARLQAQPPQQARVLLSLLPKLVGIMAVVLCSSVFSPSLAWHCRGGKIGWLRMMIHDGPVCGAVYFSK